MTKVAPRTAALYCLALWAAIWLVWLLMRFSPFDYRLIPGIGGVLLASLVIAFLAPWVAILLACVAWYRGSRGPLTWLTLAGGIAVLVGQAMLFMAMKWM